MLQVEVGSVHMGGGGVGIGGGGGGSSRREGCSGRLLTESEDDRQRV
jgi:hypothetical protein